MRNTGRTCSVALNEKIVSWESKTLDQDEQYVFAAERDDTFELLCPQLQNDFPTSTSTITYTQASEHVYSSRAQELGEFKSTGGTAYLE